MMKVAMLSKALVTGAYQRKCELIADAGVELVALVPPAWGRDTLVRAHTNGYDLRSIPIRFSGNFHLHYYPTLARELRAIQPDIVHIDEEPYNLATFLALRAAPPPSRTLFFTWQNLYRRYPPPFRWMEQYILAHASAAMAGSRDAAQVWQSKGWRGPLHVIPQFGVDERWFRPGPAPDRAAGAPFVVGYAGRLVKEKGIDLALRALAGLPLSCRLLIVGNGDQAAALERLSAGLGLRERVEFRPAVSSSLMPQVYAEMDAVVLPSRGQANWKEQFGRVLIEAMACGVPVVGSTCGEIPNVIGDAGMLFPEGDAEALRERLAALVDQPALRAELARRGRQRALSHYTMRRIAEETVNVYRLLHAAPERV